MKRFGTDEREQSTPDAIRWYAVDFDGTLAQQVWPDPGIGEAIEENLLKARELTDNGEQIVIHSARHWADYPAMERWLKEHDVPYHAIVLGKLVAKRYVDDKNILASEPTWLV